MRWLIATIVGYGLLVFVLIVTAQYMARAAARPYVDMNIPGNEVHVVVYADYWLPFNLGGGPEPGTVKLLDQENHLLDEDRVGDVRAIRDVQFFTREEKATFVYADHGRERLVTLSVDN